MQAKKSDINIDFLGESKSPLITIDNFAGGIAAIRQQAVSSAVFSPDEVTKYPGIRAPLPRDYMVASLKPLLPYIYKIFKIPTHFKPRPTGYYSLVSKTEDQLSPWQTIPHFDNTSPCLVALIHYLNEGEFGGTSFFRHKQTGYDYIDESRKDRFLSFTQQYLSTAEESPKYIGAGHPEFEEYHSVAYAVNRMILFRGYMLHSALIEQSRDVSGDAASGRLTANMFVRFA